MKKKIILSLTLLIMLFSCKRQDSFTKQSENQKKYSDEEIITIYSQIGKLHNIGLDKVFNSLQDEFGLTFKGDNSKINHDRIYYTIDKSVESYVLSQLEVNNIDLREIIKNNNSGNDIKNYLGKDLVSEIKTLKQSSLLSDKYIEAMNELNSLMDKNSTKIEYDNFIKNKIIFLSDFDEKIKFVSSVSIAYNTLFYWKKNSRKWKSFLNPKSLKFSNNVTIASKNDDGTAIGKADVVGIITGGVGGCAYGAVGGSVAFPVVGTVVGCAGLGAAGAITGGIGNSAKAAVESFVSWLTK